MHDLGDGRVESDNMSDIQHHLQTGVACELNLMKTLGSRPRRAVPYRSRIIVIAVQCSGEWELTGRI